MEPKLDGRVILRHPRIINIYNGRNWYNFVNDDWGGGGALKCTRQPILKFIN